MAKEYAWFGILFCGFIMLGVFAFTIGYKFLRKEHAKAIRLVLVYLPAALLFLAVLFLVPSVSEFRVIFGFSNTNDEWLALFGFSSYPAMLPFLVYGIWRLKNFQIRSWIVVSLVLLFVPLVSPANLRWVLMLTYPLAFCAVETLSRLKSVSWKRFGFN